MAHDPHIDPLASLRGAPTPFTLDSSLERAAIRSLRAQAGRRIAIIGIVLMTLTAVGLWLALGSASRSVANAEQVVSEPPREFPLPAPTTPSPLPLRLARPLPSRLLVVNAPQPLLADASLASPEMLRSLDVDLSAYNDIRTMLGSSDRVVMVDNTTNRETCIQITCEGGDARSIVCSAPSPSPFRVTNLDGGLIFDIERASGSVAAGPYLPVRTTIGDEEVLLWYENVPDVMAKLGGRQARPLLVGLYHTVVRRPDNSVVFRQAASVLPWSSAVLYGISGSEVEGSRIVWHSTEANELEIAISDIPLGIYELRTSARNEEVERILIVVR